MTEVYLKIRENECWLKEQCAGCADILFRPMRLGDPPTACLAVYLEVTVSNMMLELEGLVKMVPRKGAQVAQITEQDLNDVLEVRLGLEELAVQFACQRITQEELKSLEDSVQLFEQAIFIVRNDVSQKEGVTPEQLVREACRVARSPSSRVSSCPTSEIPMPFSSR